MVERVELDGLLKNLQPEIQQGEFVFCRVGGELVDHVHLAPKGIFVEPEGLTLILDPGTARKAGLQYKGRYRQITLGVFSSLDTVGLTAAVAVKLASFDISANVVAAYYHDHIFVQSGSAERALQALQELSA